MHLELLVEEPSAAEALTVLVPKIVGRDVTFAVHPHQGKADLLAKLPGRLRGYRAWLPEEWIIVILIDEDRADCHRLKGQLEDAARRANLRTRATSAQNQPPELVARIAVEELEAWFFGDVAALVEAYPRVPRTLHRQKKYRDPDHISGGTWEALERVLQKAGYFPGGLQKMEVARAVSARMDLDRNSSRSFCAFRDALRRLTNPSDVTTIIGRE